ncbi:MAG: pyrimidine dimer DNA glycosylase/endonuclease V [Candidatus Nitrosotenuis sp.]
MNIFVLDPNPEICATMHCNKHVVKMILESAQMICTTHHLHPNKTINYIIPYKKTHVNHPCNKWLRDSISNYKWLFNLTKSLNDEYKLRYNKSDHKSWLAIKDLPFPDLPNIGLTRWARAMPNNYKIGDDVVKSYQTYYLNEKQKILQYKNREVPYFIKNDVSLATISI